MSTPANVVIKIIPDTSEVESSLQQLQSTGTVSGADAKSFEAGNAAIKKQTDLVAVQAKVYNDVNTAQKKQIPTLSDIQKSAGNMSSFVLKQVAAIQAGIGKTTAGFEKYNIAIKDTSKVISGVLINATSKYNAVLVNNAQQSDNAAVAAVSLRTRLRQLTQEIATHLAAGDNVSEKYQALVTEAGQLRDAIGDAGEAIARSGSDTRGLDNVLDVAGAVTAGFSIMQGAAALVGDENEDLQKTLLKVQAAMAILNGIQQIQDLLRKEYIKTMLVSIRTQIISNAQTAIESGLKSKNIIVTKLAAAAQWALNAAMNANPLGLFLLALTAVAGALLIFSRNTRDAAEAQKELAESTNAAFDAAQKQEKLLNAGVQNRIDAVEREITLAKSRGASEAELFSLEQKRGALRLALANKNRGYYAEEIKNIGVYRAELESLYSRQSALANRTDDEGKKQKEATDAQIASIENKYNKALEVEKNYNDTVSENTTNQLEFQKKANEAALRSKKGFAEANLAVTKAGTVQELNAKIQLIKTQRSAELANVELTEGERKAIIAKSEREIKDLRKAFADQTAQEVQQYEVAKAQVMLDAAKVAWGEYSEQAINASRLLLLEQAKLDELSVQQSTASEEKKAQQIRLINDRLNLALKQQDIELMKRQASINQSQIDAYRDLIVARLQIAANSPLLDDDAKFATQQQVREQQLANLEARRSELHAKAINDREYAEEQYNTDLINNTRETEQKLAEIIQASEEQKIAIRMKYTQFAFDQMGQITDTYFAIESNKRQAELDEKLATLEKEKNSATSIKNITEQQKFELDKKYRAQEARIKNEAAQKDRNAQVNAAIVNGLLSVTNALATVQPWWAAVIAAAGAGITAGLNVAKIRTTPLPKYYTGTESSKEGLAWVGERGPELMVNPDGSMYVTPPTATMMHLEGGTKIYTAEETKAILGSNLPNDHHQELSEYAAVSGDGTLRIDYDALGQSVAKYVPKPTQIYVNADKNGISSHVIEGTSKRQILNQRYSIIQGS